MFMWTRAVSWYQAALMEQVHLASIDGLSEDVNALQVSTVIESEGTLLGMLVVDP